MAFDPAAKSVTAGRGDMLLRTLSGHSVISESQRQRNVFDTGIDSRSGDHEPETDQQPQWSMRDEAEQWNDSNKANAMKPRRLGVTWKDLTVYGNGGGTKIHENTLSQFNIPLQITNGRREKANSDRKVILDNVHGCVKPGEMLLVLGRPGAGCTTLLNILANRRFGYAELQGDVHFGSMDHEEAKRYRGQIVMNTEEELFFPTLTVGQTMDFATRMKIPAHRPNLSSPQEYQQMVKDFLLRSMGIAHTNGTKVGNEYVRGVSGFVTF
jgi:ATP-binding cassette subfamily G (WHITE) protein 2 (SNQ2)